MMGRILRILPILLVLGVTACGGTKTVTVTETQTVTTTVTQTTSATETVRVYFLRDGKVAPVAREVSATDPSTGAVQALTEGPTSAERARGFTTQFRHGELSRPGLAQLVYTTTQFPSTSIPRTRADFEDLTPAILVESPLPLQTVRSPLHATGTANTFEATFQYELRNAAGGVLAKHFVTATSGSGTRGTFDFTAPFTVDSAGPGTLTVYESSAENGSRIHVVDIPVQLEP